MIIPNMEKETIIHYDYLTGYWEVETSVPRHINKIKKMNIPFEVLMHHNGRPTMIRLRTAHNLFAWLSPKVFKKGGNPFANKGR